MDIKSKVIDTKNKVVDTTKQLICFFKREGKETYVASKILLKLAEGKEVSPEQIKFLKEQSVDFGKALALIGLQAIPGSSIAIIALEKIGEKNGFTLFPKDQVDPKEDETL